MESTLSLHLPRYFNKRTPFENAGEAAQKYFLSLSKEDPYGEATAWLRKATSTKNITNDFFEKIDQEILFSDNSLEDFLYYIRVNAKSIQHFIVKIPLDENQVLSFNIHCEENKISCFTLVDDPKNHNITRYRKDFFQHEKDLVNYIDSSFKEVISQSKAPILIESYQQKKIGLRKLFSKKHEVFKPSERSYQEESNSSKQYGLKNSFSKLEQHQDTRKIIRNSEFQKASKKNKLLYQSISDNDSELFDYLYNSSASYSEGFLESAISFGLDKDPENKIVHDLIENTPLNLDIINPSTRLSIRQQIALLKKEGVEENQITNEMILRNNNILKYINAQGQGLFIEQSEKFLKEHAKSGESYSLNKTGVCSGLGFLYGYSKWLSHYLDDLGNRKNDRQYDDYPWFQSMILYAINRESETSDAKMDAELSRFIQLVSYYFSPDPETFSENPEGEVPVFFQSKFSQFFGSTNKNEHIDNRLSINAICSAHEFEEYLQQIPKNEFIRISGTNHTVTVYRQNDAFFYYDPNAIIGEKEYSPDELSLLSQHIYADLDFNPNNINPIGIEIYKFHHRDKEPKPSENNQAIMKIHRTQMKNTQLPSSELIGLLIKNWGKFKDSYPFVKEHFLSLPNFEKNEISFALVTYLLSDFFNGAAELIDDLNISLNIQNDHESTLHYLVRQKESNAIKQYFTFLENKHVPNEIVLNEHVNIKDHNGNTPIMLALKNNNPDIIEMLLNHGADPEIKNNSGYNVKDIIAKSTELNLALSEKTKSFFLEKEAHPEKQESSKEPRPQRK